MAASASAVSAAPAEVRLGQLNLDQLSQERDGDQVVPAVLVQAAMQPGCGQGGLPASEVQADHRLDGLGEILVAAEKFLGLLQPALRDPERGQPSGRVDASGFLPALLSWLRVRVSQSSPSSQ